MDLPRLGMGSGQCFSRRQVAFAPPIWRAFYAALAVVSLITAALASTDLLPDADRSALTLLSLAVGGLAAGLACAPAPRFGSWWVHAVLATISLMFGAMMVAYDPYATAIISLSMFVGPLIAIWVQPRPLIAAHVLLASLALLVPAWVGWTGEEALLATLRLLPSMWVLTVLCVVVLEAAEAQGEELERLARRDPLTGAGNRRLLDELLPQALGAARAAGQPLTVLALDLDGFKAVNDHLGHPAGDGLLRQVARVLTAIVGETGTVIRQGGDEFAAILPGRSAHEARQLVQLLHAGLHGIHAGGLTVSSGIGAATFPHDGTTAGALLAAADSRLLAEKRQPLSAPAGVDLLALPLAPEPAAPTGLRARIAAFQLHISRQSLAEQRWLWAITGAMFFVNAALALGLWLRSPQLVTSALPWVAAGGAVLGVLTLATRPPSIGTRINHLIVAIAYLAPLATLLACQPGGAIGLGSAIFIGPHAAARLTIRRHIALHLLLATVLFGGVAAAGLVDAATTLAIVFLAGSFWLLGACVTVVLEVAEHQAAELQHLVHCDALTGAANRRALDHELGRLLDGTSGPADVSVLAIDLDGFKALNDVHGHPAGDLLLGQVAERLHGLVASEQLVARLGGDEFVVVLPGCDATQAAVVASRAGEALRTLDAGDAPLSAGIGYATATAGCATPAELLASADADLLAAKALGAAQRPARAPQRRLRAATGD